MNSSNVSSQERGLVKNILINTALAAAGTAGGYVLGSLGMKALLSSPRFRADYLSLSPRARKMLIEGIGTMGSVAGAAAGGLAAYRLQKPTDTEMETKLANFCTKYYTLKLL